MELMVADVDDTYSDIYIFSGVLTTSYAVLMTREDDPGFYRTDTMEKQLPYTATRLQPLDPGRLAAAG